MFAYRYRWFVLFSCMLLSGCGEADSEDISGKVTFKGVPVTVGRVTFFSPKGTAGILLGEDGIFTLPIPLEPGEYKVMITPVVEHDSAGDSKQGENFVEMGGESIPMRYRKRAKTPLRVTIPSDSYDFDMDP